MYKLISVKRNNKQEPSSIVILDNIYGIIIGNDYYLPTFKKHMFEIKKITSRLQYKLSDTSVIFVKNRATTKHTGT